MKPIKPTYFEARKWASFAIKDRSEIDMYDVDFLLEQRFNLSATDLLIRYQRPMPLIQWQQFQNDIRQLISGMPPQYIVGRADFYGLSLHVTSDVLIPRVETEELIDWILATFPTSFEQPMRVLDIGTGSGAIAIALKKNRPTWNLVGSDISDKALKIAILNAQNQNVAVSFLKSDVFDQIHGKFDLIVSNPPYISTDEKADMDQRVIHYEPKLALYAEDRGLAIYKRLARGAADHLTTDGRLFVEIGFHQEQAVIKLFQQANPRAVVIGRHDVSGNQRMVQLKMK